MPAFREKAGEIWSLSGLTFNHWIAQIAALEQIYRAMTIHQKNTLPQPLGALGIVLASV